MRYDKKSGEIWLSADELIFFSLCRLAGDTLLFEGRVFPARIKSHRYGEQAVCPKELTYRFEEAGYRFCLTAEADQWGEGGFTLVRHLPCDPQFPEKDILRHLRGEAFLIAHLYFDAHPTEEEVCARSLRYGTGEQFREAKEKITRAEAARFFARLCTCLGQQASEAVARAAERLPTLCDLRFPFPAVRESQRDLIQAGYRTIKKGGRLYACAPTGTGKTAATLYPALRALGEGLCDRIFYLTPKGTTAQVAADALLRFEKAGARLRAVRLTAKEKICRAGLACRAPERACHLARTAGKLDRAASDLLSKNICVAGEEEIRAVAAAHGVCPHELSLHYSLFCDVIIADYNYLFDPRVALHRYFDRGGNYTFLIDEAHDLLDRVCKIASATLSSEQLAAFTSLLRTIGQAEAAQAATELEAAFRHTAAALDGERHFEGQDGLSRAFLAQKSPPDLLLGALADTEAIIAQMIGDRHLSYDKRRALREAFFPLRDFALCGEWYDEHYEFFIEQVGECISFHLVCLDPSAFIDRRLSCGASALLFSATLVPLDYYRTVLGGTRTSEELLLDSPFDSDQLAVAVLDRISTRYADREESAPAVAEALSAMIDGRMGNYFVFCPSYTYLHTVHAAFAALRPDIRTVMQPQKSDRHTRETFLAQFGAEPTETLVGFCVTGGVFAEGIDLVGDRLIGAAVVGVGLPQPSPARDATAAYYDEIYERGKEFAYIYPGMNRVLQAAGRVIRSETDRGVLLLIDDRFRDPLYRRMLPTHWRGLKFVGDAQALRYLTRRFWEGAKV